MAKRSRRAGVVAALSISSVTALLMHVVGCGSDVAADSASDSDAAVDDAGVDRRSPSSARDSQPWEPPSPLPGWKLLSEYDTACGFYYPTDRKYLPPPVQWEPCSTIVDAAQLTDAGVSGPPGMVCQRIANGQAIMGAYLLSAHVEDDRAYLLLIRGRGEGLGSFTMVAEADGPVHTAIYNPGRCASNAFDEARFGHFMERVYDSDEDTKIGGAIGGGFDDLKPRVYFPKGHQPSTATSHHYSVGRSLFIETSNPAGVYDFGTGQLVASITLAPEDQDLYYYGYRFQEDTLYWPAATARRSVVKVWTKERGIFTLLDHDNDLTRGIAGFTTDGVDMVWKEGRGRTNFNSLVFDVYEHWTAKYSLDKATVNATKRRLLSEPHASMNDRYAVGCGYAAVPSLPSTPTDWGQTGFRLIRLSDGRSWPILDGSNEQSRELHFEMPLGVTCDHVYLQGWSDSFTQMETIRVRIDSLGEGEPAN